jgi:hypothetical protein
MNTLINLRFANTAGVTSSAQRLLESQEGICLKELVCLLFRRPTYFDG